MYIHTVNNILLPYQVNPGAEPNYNCIPMYPEEEEKRVSKLADFSLRKIQEWVLLLPTKCSSSL